MLVFTLTDGFSRVYMSCMMSDEHSSMIILLGAQMPGSDYPLLGDHKPKWEGDGDGEKNWTNNGDEVDGIGNGFNGNY